MSKPVTQIDYKDGFAQYPTLIDQRASFEVCFVELSDMLPLCAELESLIENRGLTCRVYTQNRIASVLTGAIKRKWGILSLASIAAHNLFTYDPDYEIGRDLANGRVRVEFKR
ncbi:hypothetical protein [Lonepinella sp. BR2919]|uniref:hypothetical protein n=1 Tax=unclassified Lonepinella TaxID=2642006 RepID=UPI003F6DA931